MTWVKLDDRRAMHPKLRKAGFAARGLDEAAMCQVSSDRTDGFISDDTLAVLCLAHGEKRPHRLAMILVESERWARDETAKGYVVLGYLDHNPSKAEWDDLIAKRQASGRAGGRARAQASATASATANPQAVPSRPVPYSDSEESSSSDDDEMLHKVGMILAGRELDRQRQLGNKPSNVTRWLDKVAHQRRELHVTQFHSDRAKYPDATPEELANWLEPLPSSHVPKTFEPPEEPEGCAECDHGFVELEDERVRCSACLERARENLEWARSNMGHRRSEVS